jgi:hypothetical protein
MKEVSGRLTGLVTFFVETAFYNRLLKEDIRRDRSDRNILAITLHIGGRSFIHNPRTRHAVVAGTNLSHGTFL